MYIHIYLKKRVLELGVKLPPPNHCTSDQIYYYLNIFNLCLSCRYPQRVESFELSQQILICLYIFQSAGAVEYTDGASAEG